MMHRSQNLLVEDNQASSADRFFYCEFIKITNLTKTFCVFLFILANLFVQATGLSAETMRVVLERCYNDLRLLYVPNKTLKAEGFFRSNKVSFSK